MPKPPTRQPRYRLDRNPSDATTMGAHVWWILDTKLGQYMVRVRTKWLAHRICRALNASLSKKGQ